MIKKKPFHIFFMIPAQFFLIFIDFIRNIRYNHFVMKIFFRKLKTAFFTPLLILCMLSACGCQTQLSDPVTVTGYKLNTYVQISSYINVSKSVLNGCLDLCDTYEQLCSRTLESSTLYAVNHHQTDEIPAELGELIATGLDYCRISGGAFDITIGSVSQLWVLPRTAVRSGCCRHCQCIAICRLIQKWNLHRLRTAITALPCRRVRYWISVRLQRAILRIRSKIIC